MNDESGTDLEPLIPVDPDAPPEPSQPLAPSDRAPGRRRRWWWIAGAATLAIWVTLWAVLDPGHDRRASTPRTAAPVTTPVAAVPSFGSDPFGEARGRFAAVVDGRLWIVDADSRHVVGAHGLGHAVIVAASGSSVLVRASDAGQLGTSFFVDGQTGHVVRAADGAWFPRLGGGWWNRRGGQLSSDDIRYEPPPGFDALAEVDGGFVMQPPNGGALVLWDPRSGSLRVLGRSPYTRLLAGDATRIALAEPRCPRQGVARCSIVIVEVGTGRTLSVPVPFSDQLVHDAVFSSDGQRMAVWGPSGVALVGTANGTVVRMLRAARLATLPLTFTPDGAALLVVEAPSPYRQVVVLAAGNGRFVRTWVSELQLEQIVALTS